MELLRTVDGVNAVDARIILLESYETAYGIYDHDNFDPKRPLALVAMHFAEDYTNVSRLKTTMERFFNNEVYKNFGLNLTEFLSLPREYTDLIFSIIARDAAKEAPALNEQLRELEKYSRGSFG